MGIIGEGDKQEEMGMEEEKKREERETNGWRSWTALAKRGDAFGEMKKKDVNEKTENK